MKKTALVLTLSLICTITTNAGPLRWTKYIGKQTGLTAKNFVTWKYPAVNLGFIAMLAASFADGKTSDDAWARGAHEQNKWLYGDRPSMHRIVLTETVINYLFTVNAYAMRDYADHKSPGDVKWVRWAAEAPQGLITGGLIVTAITNAHANPIAAFPPKTATQLEANPIACSINCK